MFTDIFCCYTVSFLHQNKRNDNFDCLSCVPVWRSRPLTSLTGVTINKSMLLRAIISHVIILYGRRCYPRLFSKLCRHPYLRLQWLNKSYCTMLSCTTVYIMLRNVVSTLESTHEIVSVTVPMRATEHYFPLLLFLQCCLKWFWRLSL